MKSNVCKTCNKEKPKRNFRTNKGFVEVCVKCRNKKLKRKNQKLKQKSYRYKTVRKPAKNNADNSTVYLIQMWKGKEKFLKVGMTTKTVEQRFKDSPYEYKLLDTLEVANLWLFEYEQAIHALVKDFKHYPSIKFGGYTECYNMDALSKIKTLFRY